MKHNSKNNSNSTGEKVKKALLIIDVQESLLKSDSKMHMDQAKVKNFVMCLNKSIKAFDDHGQLVIYTINEWSNPIINFLTGNVCKKGLKGTSIDEQVSIVSDKIFHKARPSVLSNKALSSLLKTESVTDLYVAGLFAEACVKSSAIDSIRNHYNVFVIEDAVGSKNEKLKLSSINFLKKKGANVITSNQLNNQ